MSHKRGLLAEAEAEAKAATASYAELAAKAEAQARSRGDAGEIWGRCGEMPDPNRYPSQAASIASLEDALLRQAAGSGVAGGAAPAHPNPNPTPTPTPTPTQVDECRRAALALQTCIANDIKPRDVMTMKAFENAVRLVMVTAGSTHYPDP